MQSAVRIVGGPGIRWISVAAIASFVTGALLLRLLMVDGPPLKSLSLTWSSAPVLHAAAVAPAAAALQQDVDDDDDGSAPAATRNFTMLLIPPSTVPPPVDDEQLRVAMVKEASAMHSDMVSVWELLKPVLLRKDLFPEARDKMQDASSAWRQLVEQLNRDKVNRNESHSVQCPYSLSWLNSTDLNGRDSLVLGIPCGLVLDSSVTLVGVPLEYSGDNFRIDLVGHKVPGETHPPIILHHNVRISGDQLSPQLPVIVQNTWTAATDWGDEQRCPPPLSELDNINKTVDGLVVCSPHVGKKVSSADSSSPSSFKWPKKQSSKPWFPYAQGHPFAATLWAGWEGFHVTIDGKHITSFEYRQNLEPWMVSGVSIQGSLQLSSVMANGLPTSENQETLNDLEVLRAPPLQEPLDLFIGVVSTANNFERRMAVRRSWMQYEAVRSGKIAVRFFVGLHQNQQVNMELWKEGVTYGDIQLLPFVDYYNLITLKTLAICIFATKIVNSRYMMKTDDDTFVRVDQVISSVNAANHSESLLYGLIEAESKPDRDVHSKWYITTEEWPSPRYPPWAHGPGYVLSNDIAKFVVKLSEDSKIQLFKLEDVAMGAWIEEFSRERKTNVSYVNDMTFFSDGCRTGYTIAHYQNPRQMVCLWNQLRHGSGPVCC